MVSVLRVFPIRTPRYAYLSAFRRKMRYPVTDVACWAGASHVSNTPVSVLCNLRFLGAGLGVAVGVGVPVAVAVGVGVAVGLYVGVGVVVVVEVAVGVNVDVGVGVKVAVGVAVGVTVAVGVCVGVGVAVECLLYLVAAVLDATETSPPRHACTRYA